MKEIELSKKGKKNKGKYIALVDDDLFDEVNQYDWCYQSAGYARNSKMNIFLHRFIWNLKFGDIPTGLEVEHIDRNKLNCCLSNLRLATRSENMCNIGKYKNNCSGFKGISKAVYKKKNKNGTIRTYERWRARINKDGKQYAKEFPYNDEGFEQAKAWYKQKSLELHKEFPTF